MEESTLFPMPPERDVRFKNTVALLIVFAGLFVGSLFVDVAQLITGTGFSGTALREQSVLETAGKTWVAFTEPAIGVQVITDDQCADCTPDDALVWMRRIIPTLSAKHVAYDSFEGSALIAKHGITTLPAFVFDTTIDTSDFYAEAAPLFRKTGSEYFFDMNKIGLPVGKYLKAPETGEGDIRLGNSGASTVVTVFTDFTCEHCKDYHATLKQLLSDYGDRVSFVVKLFPLPSHPQSDNAALAAACANAQGLFLPYTDILFQRQADWSERANSVPTLKNYAWLVKGMKGTDFAKCLDQQTYASLVEANFTEGTDFNIQAAPATFINEEFVSGAAPIEDIREILEAKLASQE